MKSDQATVQKRVEEILALRLLGAMATDIRRHAEEAGWNVGIRQLQRYTAAADDLMARELEEDRPKLLGYHFAARRALYARAMAVSDYGTAARVLKDEAELFGLYAAKKTEVSGPGGGPMAFVELTHAERDAAIAAVLARPRLDCRSATHTPAP